MIPSTIQARIEAEYTIPENASLPTKIITKVRKEAAAFGYGLASEELETLRKGNERLKGLLEELVKNKYSSHVVKDAQWEAFSKDNNL